MCSRVFHVFHPGTWNTIKRKKQSIIIDIASKEIVSCSLRCANVVQILKIKITSH